MTENIEIPDTFGERMEKLKSSNPVFPHPDDPIWYSQEDNEKSKKELTWAAPYDARFPQVRKQRQCFNYYVDFFRCQELMGKDYHPCKFFKNVYKDFCPSFWVEKWDEWVEEGRFPAKFDR